MIQKPIIELWLVYIKSELIKCIWRDVGSETSREHDLIQAETDCWVDDVETIAENSRRYNPANSKSQLDSMLGHTSNYGGRGRRGRVNHQNLGKNGLTSNSSIPW